jgi:hypothetical protein
MPVAEPSNDFGLWAEVKAITGWPDTNEDQVQHLSQAWGKSSTDFGKAAEFKVNGGPWQDGAGNAYVRQTGTLLATAASAGRDMQLLSASAELFATEVKQTKEAVADYIERSALVYGGAAQLPGGVDAAFRQTFVNQLAANVSGLFNGSEQNIRDTLKELRELKRGVQTPVHIYSSLNRTIRGAAALNAQVANNRAQSLYKGIEGQIRAHLNSLGKDASAINKALAGIEQRNLLDAGRIADAAADNAGTKLAAFEKAVVPASRLMRGIAVAGVAGNIYDFVANPLHETGVRRGISMGVDAIGAASGGAALAAAAGALSLSGVGLPLVASGLVIAGGWAAGTYVYDHWDDISHGAKVATDWVGGVFQ